MSAAVATGGAPPSRRLFFALLPGTVARAALCTLARQHVAARARLVRASDLHLTLLFLGQVSDAVLPRLCARAATLCAAPCVVRLERLERWQGGLLCATGPAPMALRSLHAQLLAVAIELGLRVDARPLRAHVTLARGAGRAVRAAPMAALRWQARSFCLMESRPRPGGGRYWLVGRWRLDRASDIAMQHEECATSD
ncbi:MAG: RNA 2',3'-cyclic phosphodiesterase [Gammaproteobacteria bacterium]|nr:RNA 2',3'-cyclic phosphodiesterase [Gammaproteobacteria bacterium]